MFAHFQICISVPLSTYNEAKKIAQTLKQISLKKQKEKDWIVTVVLF